MDVLIRWLLIGLEKLGIYIGKEGVFLAELRESPDFQIEDGLLVITTSHSQKHSAKEVFRFKADFSKNQCLIRAYQKLMTRSLGEKYRQGILIPNGFNHEPSVAAEFFWVDPDGTRHRIDMTSSLKINGV